jgi:hypothetical protein
MLNCLHYFMVRQAHHERSLNPQDERNLDPLVLRACEQIGS